MQIRFALIICLLMCVWSSADAQNEARHWYFGNGTVMTFTDSGPVIEAGKPLKTNESSAAVSDRTTGDLLFYTDGVTVWDATDNPMPNGSNLKGHWSTTQILVTPMPGSDYLYYIFTANAAEPSNPKDGLHYSIADMRLNNGRGDITAKNIRLLEKSSEKITGTPHCNGRDFWIVACHPDNGELYSFLLTDTGIVAQGFPRISQPGMASGENAFFQGYMKFSPDGRQLVLVGTSGVTREAVYLLDFNNRTGAVSNARVLEYVPEIGTFYGASFSPDNSKLYLTGALRTDQWGWRLMQYNVELPTIEDIRASRTIIGDVGFHQLALQIGPDGKIYIPNEEYLDVIHEPNAAGSACRFERRIISVQPEAGIGLPSFMEHIFNVGRPPQGCPIQSGFELPSDICAGQCIAVRDTSEGDILSWLWSFPGGEPSSFAGRYPPEVCYAEAGVYPVLLTTESADGVSTTSRTITVRAPETLVVAMHDTAGSPGKRLLIPLRGVTRAGGSIQGNNLITELRFSKRLMEIVGATKGSVTSRTEGNERIATVILPGYDITGEGILTELECIPLLSSWSETNISVAVLQSESECGTVEASSTAFRIQDYCLGYDLNRFRRVNMTVFPVPARESLQVLLQNAPGDVQIQLFDTFGRVVAEQHRSGCGDNEYFTVDTQQIAAGMYTLVVQTWGGTQTTVIRTMK